MLEQFNSSKLLPSKTPARRSEGGAGGTGECSQEEVGVARLFMLGFRVGGGERVEEVVLWEKREEEEGT